jgi:phospholipid/cholesterol/gamma-HCH transport system ATP-binding protein
MRENLAFPLKRVLKITDETEIEKRSMETLAAVGLSETMDKMPSELSGGMRKRVALARTLIVKPACLSQPGWAYY